MVTVSFLLRIRNTHLRLDSIKKDPSRHDAQDESINQIQLATSLRKYLASSGYEGPRQSPISAAGAAPLVLPLYYMQVDVRMQLRCLGDGEKKRQGLLQERALALI